MNGFALNVESINRLLKLYPRISVLFAERSTRGSLESQMRNGRSISQYLFGKKFSV